MYNAALLPEETRRGPTRLWHGSSSSTGCQSRRFAQTGRPMTSDKIRPHHLDRKAILYVRQSSSHQVLHNRESRALQYAMRDRLLPGTRDRRSRSPVRNTGLAGFSRSCRCSGFGCFR